VATLINQGDHFTSLIRNKCSTGPALRGSGYRRKGEVVSITRKSVEPIKVLVLPEEKKAIGDKAKSAGLSVSAYLRNVGMGTPVTGVADQEAVMEMVKINADLGRLGGLLKMWLTNDEKLDLEGYDQAGLEATIIEAMREIKAAQALLFQKASEL